METKFSNEDAEKKNQKILRRLQKKSRDLPGDVTFIKI